MQSVVGPSPSETFEPQDVDAYWRGRIYIEAARSAHEASSDPTAHTLNFAAISPFLKDAGVKVEAERETHEGELPDAVFEEGHTLEPRFVIMLALLLDAERPVDGKTIRTLTSLSGRDRDKRFIVVLNGHNTKLSQFLAREAGFDVSENGLIEMAKVIEGKMSFAVEDFPHMPSSKGMDESIRQVRQKHNRVGRHSGNQRFNNVKPKRQSFKCRGR